MTIVPKDKDAKAKFTECEKEVKRARFLKAIEAEGSVPLSETISIDDIGVFVTQFFECVVVVELLQIERLKEEYTSVFYQFSICSFN